MLKFKKILSFIICLSITAFLASNALAANLGNAGSIATDVAVSGDLITDPTQTPSIEILVGTIISSVLGAFMLVYFMFVIYGGFAWQTAKGEKEKVEKAKNLIKDASIGMAIILGGYAISYYVLHALLESGPLLNPN